MATIDIHLYVRRDDEMYEVGRMLCPVVPRIGETVYLRMSLMAKGAGIDWRLNPDSPIRYDTAYFKVEDVSYEGYNIEDIEEGMGAAPYSDASAVNFVQLYVSAINEDTQVYVDRVIKNSQVEET